MGCVELFDKIKILSQRKGHCTSWPQFFKARSEKAVLDVHMESEVFQGIPSTNTNTNSTVYREKGRMLPSIGGWHLVAGKKEYLIIRSEIHSF